MHLAIVNPTKNEQSHIARCLDNAVSCVSHCLFRGWRRMVLSAFGAKVGRGVHVYPTARIIMPWSITLGEEAVVGDRAILYALRPIRIGARATVSQGAHLCAGSHDITHPVRSLIRPPVIVEDDAWGAAEAFVGPGVTIGCGAVLGARAVAMRDVPPGVVVVGNPARVLRRLFEDST